MTIIYILERRFKSFSNEDDIWNVWRTFDNWDSINDYIKEYRQVRPDFDIESSFRIKRQHETYVQIPQAEDSLVYDGDYEPFYSVQDFNRVNETWVNLGTYSTYVDAMDCYLNYKGSERTRIVKTDESSLKIVMNCR